MKFLLSLFFILLAFGQLARISIYPSITVASYEFVIPFIVLTTLLYVTFDETKLRSYFSNNMVRAWSIFLEVLLMSLLFSLHKFTTAQNMVAAAYLIRFALYGALFFSLRTVKKNILEQGIHLFTGLTIFFSCVQYFLFPRMQALTKLGWDPHEFRVFGSFLDVTTTGMILCLLFFYYLMKHVLIENRRLMSVAVISMLFLLILLTYSRITYIGMAVGLILLMAKKIQIKAVIGIAMAFIIGIFILPKLPGESTNLQRTFSISSRIQNMQKGLAYWKDNKVFGVGYNQLSSLVPSSGPYDHADSAFSSSYITILASAGLVGFLASLFLVMRLYMNTSATGKILVSILAVSSVFDNVFLMGSVLAVFIPLIALEDNR